MQLHIDFSIYTSTPEAFGQVSGDIEWPEMPNVGESVSVLQGKRLPNQVEGFSGVLRVTSISPVKLPGGDSVVIGLEDVELKSRKDAETLRDFLEQDMGLFCVDYKRDLP